MKAAKRNQRTYVLLYDGEALLFLRRKCMEEWSLPHGFNKKDVLEFLHQEFLLETDSCKRLPRFFIRDGKKVIEPVLYLVTGDLKHTESGYEWAFLEEADVARMKLDEVERSLIRRAFIYAPFFRQMPRTVPLLPPEGKAVTKMEEVLHYYRRYVPGYERKQFFRLLTSAASYRRIMAAYRIICETYRVDPKGYDEYMAYCRKRREVLR